MHKLKWDDLRYVLAVAETGSLSAAGRALGVNHATVLRRIAALETAYGVRLFDRMGGGYRIKPEAVGLLTAARSMDRTMERLQRSLTTIGKGLEGSFRLATTDAIAEALLPRYIAALREQHPNLQVELKIANAHIDMTRPDAEILLRPALALPDGLTGRRATNVGFRIFASADYLARNTSADPRDHVWLRVAPPLSRSPVGAWQDQQPDQSSAITADSFLTLARLAEAGLGLAMLPAFLGKRSSSLRPATGFRDSMTTVMWVATHADLLQHGHIGSLVDFFADEIARDSDLLK